MDDLLFYEKELPQFQGIMASFWAMMAGEKIGGSLHFISDSSIDTGEIIDICYLDVKPDKSMIWHIFQLYYGGVKMIMNVMENLSENKIIFSRKQDVSKARYFNYPEQKDFEIFKNKYLVFDKKDYLEMLGEWF